MSDEQSLAAVVARLLEGMTLRDAEAFTGIPRSTLSDLLKGKGVPYLDTLEKLSNVFNIPLWRLVELCGFNVGLGRDPSEQARRLEIAIEILPEFRSLVDQLVQLQPDDLEAVLSYLEGLLLRKNRQR